MKRFVIWLMLVTLVASCAVNPTPTPVAVAPTQAPTWTPQPTFTPNPTYTPRPTLTPFPTATVLPTATFVPPTLTPTPVTYVVQPGDMLNVIARQFQVAPEAIIATNNIQNPNIIEVGSVLVIPIGPAGGITATAQITPTIRPVVARPVAPVAPPPPPSNMVYAALRIVYPENGTTLKYDETGKQGGTDDITFVWLPVGPLASGTQPCSWQGQPNGTEGWLWDRYQIEFNPPLYNNNFKKWLDVFHNDQGTSRVFSLLEFAPGVSYTWRVAVGRWCVASNYDNQDPKHQGFLGLVSPYTEPRTFMYTR